MKTIVIYTSQTGFTKKYAQWIAEATSADILESSKANVDILLQYDTIVYGGSLHAVGIQGIKLITKHFDALKHKKLIVFAVGASLISDKVIVHVSKENFTEEQIKHIHFFYFRGGFNYKKLGIVDKLLMKIFIVMLKFKKHPKPDEKGMIDAYDHPFDATDIHFIGDLVSLIKK